MYARKRDQQRTMDGALAKGTPESEARHVRNPAEYIVQRLEEIDERASHTHTHTHTHTHAALSPLEPM